MEQPSYFLQCTPPSSTFIKSLTFLQVFGRLLGPGSFNSPKGPLAYKQVFFLITFDGIGVIPTTTIASIAYLKSWAFIASIIATKFMVDHCPFLLKALAQADDNTLFFQQHFKVACDLILPPTHTCLLLFE